MIIQLTRIGILGIIVVLSLLLSPSQAFASSLSSTSYVYDTIGNIQAINNTIDSSKNMSYSYDDLYRLTGATGGYSAGYSYDRDGNILTKNEDQNLTLTYIPSDSVASHGPKSVNGRLLRYDLDGNLIEDAFSNLKIVYDYDNRPVEIQSLTTDNLQLTTKYYYDGEGKRVKKEVYENGALKKTVYYVNQYYEKETPVGKPQVIRKFYAGAAYRENSDLKYTTFDHLSSTTLITTNTGAKQNEYRYYPYGSPNGSPITSTSSLPPNSWIGQKRDDESGLYFLNARYYSPVYGRFVSADSVEDPSARGNRFIYSANNPITISDPNGQCPPCLVALFYLALVGTGVVAGGTTYAYGVAPNPAYQSAWNNAAGYQGDFDRAQQAGLDVANVGFVMATAGEVGFNGVRSYSTSKTSSVTIAKPLSEAPPASLPFVKEGSTGRTAAARMLDRWTNKGVTIKEASPEQYASKQSSSISRVQNGTATATELSESSGQDLSKSGVGGWVNWGGDNPTLFVPPGGIHPWDALHEAVHLRDWYRFNGKLTADNWNATEANAYGVTNFIQKMFGNMISNANVAESENWMRNPWLQ